jgi:hypothetical protein
MWPRKAWQPGSPDYESRAASVIDKGHSPGNPANHTRAAPLPRCSFIDLKKLIQIE